MKVLGNTCQQGQFNKVFLSQVMTKAIFVFLHFWKPRLFLSLLHWVPSISLAAANTGQISQLPSKSDILTVGHNNTCHNCKAEAFHLMQKSVWFLPSPVKERPKMPSLNDSLCETAAYTKKIDVPDDWTQFHVCCTSAAFWKVRLDQRIDGITFMLKSLCRTKKVSEHLFFSKSNMISSQNNDNNNKYFYSAPSLRSS